MCEIKYIKIKEGKKSTLNFNLYLNKRLLTIDTLGKKININNHKKDNIKKNCKNE